MASSRQDLSESVRLQGQGGSYGNPVAQRESGGISWGWLLAGAAVVGLGVLTWYSFGPDIRRYIKIRSM